MRRRGAVARRYAKALHALAREQGPPEAVGRELEQFGRLVSAETQLRHALHWPWIRAAAKRAVVDEVADRLGLSPLARHFLGLLVSRRRLDLLPEILAAYRALVDEAAGRLRARVLSAMPLSDAQRAALRERLGRRLGRTVLLETEVAPALLAGFVVEVGSRLWDASLLGQLRQVRERMTTTDAWGTA